MNPEDDPEEDELLVIEKTERRLTPEELSQLQDNMELWRESFMCYESHKIRIILDQVNMILYITIMAFYN